LKDGLNYNCRWKLYDVFFVAAVIVSLVFLELFGVTRRLIDFFRLHFFIFTKEPRLFYYLTVYISTIIMKATCLVLIIFIVKLRGASFWKDVVIGDKRIAGYKKYLPVFILICVIFRVISMRDPLVPNIPFNSVFEDARIIGNILLISSILFIAPFAEEAIFRGFIFPALDKHTNRYSAIIITSLLFAFAHYPQIKNDLTFMAVIFFLSVIITYARARTGSTWVAIILHHIYNLVYVIVGFIKFAIAGY